VIRINLLPKEERARRHVMPSIKLPRMGSMVPFVVLGALGLGVVTTATLQSRQVAKLQVDVAAAREEADRYRPQLEKIREITQKREEVRTRLDIIARLDRDRYYRVQLLDEMSRSLPENMWITGLNELSERRFKIDGVTFSNFIVARFMERLDAAEHWRDVDLDVSQKGEMEDLDVVKFTLTSNAQPSFERPLGTEVQGTQISTGNP
jgi:type IV pilus assembly protein PilN